MRGVFHQHASAPPVPGQARGCWPPLTGRWVKGAPRKTSTAPTRSPKPLSRLRHRRHDPTARPAHPSPSKDIEHFASFTGDTFYAQHGRGEAGGEEPVLRRAASPTGLPHRVRWPPGLFRAARLRSPCFANYGHRQPPLPDPGQAGPDALTVTLTCTADQPPGPGDYGEVRWDTELKNSRLERWWPPTTCSPWSPRSGTSEHRKQGPGAALRRHHRPG